jgi:hypothetical protein
VNFFYCTGGKIIVFKRSFFMENLSSVDNLVEERRDNRNGDNGSIGQQMSSRLEQALKRLDSVVVRLEEMPPPVAIPAATTDSGASDSVAPDSVATDSLGSNSGANQSLSAEIAEIRVLVDRAMTMLTALAKAPRL